MSVIVEAKYMAHEGGTKFYEVMQFYHVEAKRFMVINRWGKIQDREHGGQIKIEKFTDVRQAQDAANQKIQEKSKRGYVPTGAPFGLHSGPKQLKADAIRLRLGGHYRNVELIDAIVAYLDVPDELAHLATDTADDVIEETPEAYVPRGDDWASW